MRLVGSPMPPLITATCHRIKPAGRVRFPAGCCSRAQTASSGSKVGRLSQPGAAPRQKSSSGARPRRVSGMFAVCFRWPCGANDPLGWSVPPLTPVGPWRLQTTRTECWRRGCRALLGDRRGEFRPHLAAHSHENNHNDGGERQAHQTSHKPAHRHSGIPNSRADCASS